MMLSVSALTFSLVSCGGGGGGGGTTTPTITSISPVGMVQSSVARTVTLFGTNFTSSMMLSVTDSTGVTSYPVGTTTYTASNNSLATSVTISTAPNDRYVKVNVKSGSTTVTSTVLGVAQNYKTLATNIQPIFNTFCIACHDSTTNSGGLDLTSGNSAGNLIVKKSQGCSSTFRVTAGDPRPGNSVLVNKIQAKTLGTTPCYGSGMPLTDTHVPAFNATNEVSDIMDWIAAGAY